MPVSYKRIPLSDSIGYTEILDSKFKTNTIRVSFFQPMEKETAAARALAFSLLSVSNQEYPSMAALSRKVNSLYGASLSSGVSKIGDLQCASVFLSIIDSAYALEQEDLVKEMLDLLLTTLFKPNALKDSFIEFEFQIKRKDLLDTIEAEINEKRSYAIAQAMETAYVEEPAALSCYGTKEDALKLTPQIAYAVYQETLRTAPVEIYFVGSKPQPQVQEALQNAFAAVPRTNIVPCTFTAPSPLKPEPVTVIEPLPVNQCKMVLAFKYDCTDRFAIILMNSIFGGTSSSKLFANVREKLSLCYYCASRNAASKCSLVVDCGVERENVEKAKTEILHQLQDMQQGNFTEEDIENARMSIYNSIRGVGDTASSYIAWYESGYQKNEILTTAETIARYAACTKEQIIEAANSVKLDTIYIMDIKEQEETANA